MRTKQAEKRGKKTKFNPKSFPISFPNLGKSERSHIKQKPYIVFDQLNLIQYMASVADRLEIFSNFPILQEKLFLLFPFRYR